jgi:hypothetical protein
MAKDFSALNNGIALIIFHTGLLANGCYSDALFLVLLVGARARGFYTKTIHSVSPAVPTIPDVDSPTAAAASAPSSGSWKYVFLWLTPSFRYRPTSITNALK